MKDYFMIHPKVRRAPKHNVILYLKFHKTPISNLLTVNSTKYYTKSENTEITQISLNDEKSESKTKILIIQTESESLLTRYTKP
jgi:hypothetical protein